MIIKVSTLTNGKHEIPFNINVKELKLEKPFEGDLSLLCKVDKSDHQIIINCDLAVDVDFTCDRCNSNFIQTLENEFQIVYFFDKESADNENTNIRYLPEAETKIDLTVDAIEYANCSIPMKKLCDEDCKGLCGSCGIDLNEEKCDCKSEEINPVWDKLLELKDKLN